MQKGMPAEESPRFFPEILLNARDTNVIELYIAGAMEMATSSFSGR